MKPIIQLLLAGVFCLTATGTPHHKHQKFGMRERVQRHTTRKVGLKSQASTIHGFQLHKMSTKPAHRAINPGSIKAYHRKIVASRAGSVTRRNAVLSIHRGNLKRPSYFAPTVYPDQTFGANGFVLAEFGVPYAGWNAIVLQPGGKTVVAGWLYAGAEYGIMARYDSLGVLDESFADGGVFVLEPGTDAAFNTTASLPDGRFLAAGFIYNGSYDEFLLMRFTPDGAVDSTFGDEGFSVIDFGGEAEIYSLGLQPDGKALVSGYLYGGSYNTFALARYDTVGNLDTTFNGFGVATLDFGNNSFADALALMTDGRIVADGYVESFDYDQPLVARFMPDGSPDTTFGIDGATVTDLGDDADAYTLALQPNGYILAGGYVYTGSSDDFLVMRYDTSGALDPAFGDGGVTATDFTGDDDYVYSMALLADGKILVTGEAYDGSNDAIGLARYDTLGNLDGSFGLGGLFTAGAGGGYDYGGVIALLPGGKFLVGGQSQGPSNEDPALSRYLVMPVGISVMGTSNTGGGTAAASGVVNAVGLSTNVWFLWGTTPGIYTDSVMASPSSVSADTGVLVIAPLSGLSAHSFYYITIATSSSAGYFRGNDSKFCLGGALLFDGQNDYVSVPNSDSLQLSTSYTIEAWIKPHVFNWLGGIVSKYNVPGANGFTLRLSQNSPYTSINFDEMETDPGLFTADTWYHIAAVNNGGTRVLYVNGVSVPLTGTPLSVVANDNFVGIGEDYIPSARYFNGTIDEVRIWNVARDSSSIRRDMHRVFSSAPPGLVAYYTFDVAKNDTALDLVAGNEATLMNFNFDNSDGWVLQTIPAGQGTSADTSGFTTGTASLGNVSLATTDDFDNSVELIATSIGASPDSLPVGSSTVLGDRYWTIDVYGTPGTFSTCLTFTVPASFTNNGAASPALYTLYTRTSTSDGAWSPVVSGASNLTSTTVSFCGVTGFCQFAIGTDDVLPIQLASLTGKVIDGGSVELDWSTVSETNNYGFYVERKQQGSPSFATVSKLIPGAGTSLALHRYSWTDNAVTSGSYVYRLRQVDLSGHSSYSQQVVVAGVTGVRETGLPKEFGLSQNYPNPFNPTTVVKYQLPVTSHVKLVVYDVLGQAVATLADGVQEAGYKSTTFDGSRFSSGVYVYRIEAGSYTKTMKLLLVK